MGDVAEQRAGMTLCANMAQVTVDPRLPRRRPTLADQVVAQLQNRLLSGEWTPGDRLPTEAELCEELAVSRTVVRDALRTLSSRGLVTIRQGSGTVVSEPSDEVLTTSLVLLFGHADVTIGQVVAARAPLEAALGEEAAAHVTAEEVRAMRDLVVEMRSAAVAGDLPQLERLHRSWHLALLDGAHNPALSVMLRPLHHVIAVSSLPPELDDLASWDIEAHEEVVQALEVGDADRTRTLMREHFAFIDEPRFARLRRTKFSAARTLAAFDPVLRPELAVRRRTTSP